ncbi:amino acid adenylation domain-containing protein [Actinosynnema pretiosum]|uniref:amino acid adenylation domain-containing protein n=1 Tax=Actinosynnema pretiosum TaxID=42197 RepID=UPI0031D86FFB
MTTSVSRAGRGSLLRALRASSGIERRPDAERAIPSTGQQRLWFLDRLSPGAAYNVPLAFRLRGALDLAALRAAVAGVLARHEALRSTFTEVDGAPRLVVHDEVVVVVDPVAVDPARWRDWLAGVVTARFDLAEGPLVRVGLARLGPDEHLLCVVVHHVVFDGWSLDVLVRELSALYAGEAPAPPSAQFPDFAAWQAERLAGGRGERDAAHWRAALDGATDPLELPLDLPRPVVATQRGGDVPLALSEETSAGLRALAAEHGGTLFPVLQAGFQALLGQYAGRGDVVVGTPAAGRTHPGTEGAIGFFVNTVPLRVDVARAGSFRALVARCREVVLTAYEHQDVPLEALTGADGQNPVRAWVQLDGAPRSFTTGDGLSWEPVPVSNGGARFDVAMTFTDGGGPVTGVLRYARDLFTRATAERVVAHLVALLDAVAADPDLDPWLVPLWTPEERRLVDEVNGAEVELPEAALCLHELTAAQAARTPDAVAVRDDDVAWTFREVDERANRLARRLRELGAGPGSVVAVCLRRSAHLVPALLGVLKAGAAYTPLDPDHPVARLRHAIADARPVALVTDAGLAGGPLADALATAPSAVLLDRDADALAALPGTPPGTGVTTGHPAYLLHTSGSTGRPKGVLVHHRAVVNHMLWMADVLRPTEADVVLQKTPFSFDVSLWELFLPLLTGAGMVLARPGAQRDPDAIAELIDRAGVTLVHFVPSMLRAFLDHVGPRALAGVRALLCSGEALPRELRDRVLGSFDGELLNLYGPTETAIHSTWARMTPDDVGTSVHIGRPVWNTTAHVLRPDLRPAPFGVPGELFHGGRAVGSGYLGRPGLTAERFVPDPRSPGGRLYATGDVVRWRPDGVLEYLGREDHQVKVNGQRVETGEVEAALAAHAGVRQAAVTPVPDHAGGTALAAYFVPAGPDVPTAAELREHLAAHLPAGWLPSHYAALESFPTTSSGKLDRGALPAPSAERAGPSAEPVTAAERLVARVWREVLGRSSVSRDDDFFALGGHSLLLIKVVARIEGATGVRLGVQAAYEAPVLADLARLVDGGRGVRSLPPVRPASGEPVASYGQQRIWFLDRLTPGGSAYNVQLVLRLRGEVDAGRLRAALTEVVRRHDVLRTVLDDRSGAPVPRVLPAGGVPLPVLEPGGDDRDEVVRRCAGAEARRPFDLAAGPVLRAALIGFPRDPVLVLTVHHIATDAWSLDLLVDELTALHHGHALPEPGIGYADYAAWQRERVAGEHLAAELEFWRAALDGAPPVLELPSTRVRPAAATHRGRVLRFRVGADLVAAVDALAARRGATRFMVLLAAFAVVVGRSAGTPDVVVGTPVAGRGRPELEPLQGFFVNTVPLRVDLSRAATFADALAEARRTSLAAFEHQDVPFEKLVEHLAPERDLAHQPIHQVMFEVHRTRPDADAWASVLPVGVDNDTAKCDLTLVASDRGGELDCGFRYAVDVLTGEDVDALRERWLLLLAAVVAEAADTEELSGLGLPAPVRADGGPSVGLDALTLFRDRARTRPDAEALVCGDERVAYRDLERRVTALGDRLRRAGAGPERLVAVHLPRGTDLVVALLAAWDAGAGFVALDPELSPARKAAVLADARPDLVVTAEPLDTTAIPVPPTGARPDAAPREPAHPDHRAYVVYTSGSTGTPKGIAGTRRGVANYLADLATRLGPEDTALAVTTVSFDAVLRDLLLPLALGARVVVAPGGGADLDGVVDALVAERVTALPAIVPSLLRAVTARAAERGVTAPDLRSVRVSGEVLNPADVAGVVAIAPNARVVNLYGPSETTMTTTWHAVDAPDAASRVPVGRPIGGAAVEVLDAAMRPVGVGVPGRVHIGGAGLARGYHGKPGLTAARFVPHPRRPGERLYDTGDRGRFLPDGTLQYLGRADDDLKVNGHRVDPAEVEAVLAAHPAVAEAAVRAHDPDGRGPRLVACVVAAAGHALPAWPRLRADLAERLPTTHVPVGYVELDRLPRTATGKLDRRALPVPEVGPEHGAGPRNEVEELITRIWADVLGLDSVGVAQDFFALGGHSLLAARATARMGEVLGVAVPLRALFEHSTAADLAAWVDDLGEGAVPDPVAGDADRSALSAAQRRLWRLERGAGRYALYNVPVVRRLRGALDTAALAAALSGVVRRHEALRTVFPERAGGPVARVLEPRAVVLDVVDDVPEYTSRPFDLARGPLLRAGLHRLGPDDHVLCVVVHHLVADGWSVGVLLREVTTLYQGLPLPEPVLQYAHFVRWQDGLGPAEEDLAHWRAALADVEPLIEVAADYPALTGERRPPRGRVTLVLPDDAAAGVRARCARLRATPFMVLMAAFQVALGERFGRAGFAVAAPSANRDRAGLDGMIGFLADMVLLRAELHDRPGLDEVVARVRRQALDAHAHRRVPFEALLDALAPDQADSHAPVAQALFNMQDFPHDRVPVPGLEVERTGANEVWARYPLTLFAHDRPDGVLLDLVHDRELVDGRLAGELLDAMSRLLAEDWGGTR